MESIDQSVYPPTNKHGSAQAPFQGERSVQNSGHFHASWWEGNRFFFFFFFKLRGAGAVLGIVFGSTRQAGSACCKCCSFQSTSALCSSPSSAWRRRRFFDAESVCVLGLVLVWSKGNPKGQPFLLGFEALHAARPFGRRESADSRTQSDSSFWW